jgi:Spy/CpxP family protein refolding chaperone
VLARDRAEAKILLEAYQARRAGRYEITFDRLEVRHKNKELTKEQYDHEVARRKHDFSRYDIVTPSGVTPAEAPLKLASIEEVK